MTHSGSPSPSTRCSSQRRSRLRRGRRLQTLSTSSPRSSFAEASLARLLPGRSFASGAASTECTPTMLRGNCRRPLRGRRLRKLRLRGCCRGEASLLGRRARSARRPCCAEIVDVLSEVVVCGSFACEVVAGEKLRFWGGEHGVHADHVAWNLSTSATHCQPCVRSRRCG